MSRAGTFVRERNRGSVTSRKGRYHRQSEKKREEKKRKQKDLNNICSKTIQIGGMKTYSRGGLLPGKDRGGRRHWGSDNPAKGISESGVNPCKNH